MQGSAKDGLYLFARKRPVSETRGFCHRRPTGRCNGAIKVVDPCLNPSLTTRSSNWSPDKFGFSDRLFKNIALARARAQTSRT